VARRTLRAPRSSALAPFFDATPLLLITLKLREAVPIGSLGIARCGQSVAFTMFLLSLHPFAMTTRRAEIVNIIMDVIVCEIARVFTRRTCV